MLNKLFRRNDYRKDMLNHSPIFKRTCISKYHKVRYDGYRTLANGSIIVGVIEQKPKTSKRR